MICPNCGNPRLKYEQHAGYKTIPKKKGWKRTNYKAKCKKCGWEGEAKCELDILADQLTKPEEEKKKETKIKMKYAGAGVDR